MTPMLYFAVKRYAVAEPLCTWHHYMQPIRSLQSTMNCWNLSWVKVTMLQIFLFGLTLCFCTSAQLGCKALWVTESLMMTKACSLHVRILGEGSIFHSLLALFFFKMEINLHTQIPFLSLGSVHSGSVSRDVCGWVFPDELCASSFPWQFPELCLDSTVSPLWLCECTHV